MVSNQIFALDGNTLLSGNSVLNLEVILCSH